MNIFWLNNIHFAIEFFGVAVLVVAAWLSTDAYVLTRERKLLAKVFGFGLVAAWQLVHAIDVRNEFVMLLGLIALGAGLVCIAINMYSEAPPPRPKTFDLVFVIPSIAGLLGRFYLGAAVLAGIIALISFRRVRSELNRPLIALGIAFGLLAASFVVGAFAVERLAPDALWYGEHGLRLGGFAALTVWVWQYLKPRLKEELLLIFVAMALITTLAVTFTFSALLLGRLQHDASESLTANANVFTYTLDRIKAELAAKSSRIGEDAPLAAALAKPDFAALEDRAGKLYEAMGVDFLTITDETGSVIHRVTWRTARGESLKEDAAVAAALGGHTRADLSTALPEGLSVRSASPILDKDGKLLGTVEIGTLLDAAFLDGFKSLTGLDVTLFAGDAVHASTIDTQAGSAPAAGILVTDAAVRHQVFLNGKTYSGLTMFLGRPHVAVYVPLAASDGKIIGMVSASRPAMNISQAAVATNRLTLFTTLAIVLAMLIPAYAAVRKVMREAI